MQVDTRPFPMNIVWLEGKKFLLWPEAAEDTNKTNVVVGDPRNNRNSEPVSKRTIVLDRKPGGKETLKIIIKNPTFGKGTQAQRGAPTPRGKHQH